jgi:Zn-dependent peptidase ImmA (M78 family)/transcriptional regulator with XRE-family HTH domain
MALPLLEIGKRIRKVREETGIARAALAVALGVDEITVDRMEAGTLEDLPGDFILIAGRVLRTDFRYFISTDLDSVEEETRQIFRAIKEPSANDRLAIRRFINFCTAEWELEKLLEVQKPPIPPIYPERKHAGMLHKDQGAKAAEEERERLGLGTRPITNIFHLVRSQGVRVCRQRLERSDVSGLTALHPKAGVCILANYDDDLFRQFFSTAHEYGHVLFEREEVKDKGCVVSFRFSQKDLLEIRANAFAAEFLLPRHALDHYPQPGNLDDLMSVIERISRDYLVNTETVAIRAFDNQWITARTLRSFQKARPVVIPRHQKMDPEIPADLSPSQADRRALAFEHGVSAHFLELLRKALAEEAITFSRFAEMLDLVPEEAVDFVREIGLAL